MKLPLDRIEARLQAFIEGSLSALIPQENPHSILAHELVEAMENNLTRQPDQSLFAPNAYILLTSVNPSDAILSDPAVLSKLANILEQTAREAGIQFALPPTIRVRTDPELLPGQYKIIPDFHKGDEDVNHTAAVEVETPRPPSARQIPTNAYLIVDGSAIFPLLQPTISIGRRPDNHLVVSDLRVSRSHAMLRVVNGQFFVFDLNSMGGTYLNGKRITQAVLRPGDVISLAGVPIIYGQDTPEPSPDELDHTHAMSPDRSTDQAPDPKPAEDTDDR